MFDYDSHPGAGTLGDKIMKGFAFSCFGLCVGLWVYMVASWIFF